MIAPQRKEKDVGQCALGMELPPIVRIEPYRDGTFGYAADDVGTLARQCPVLEHEELIDVVAWPLNGVSPWWTLRGVATLLGEHELRAAWWESRPARLVETPQAYLDQAGECACVLDWSCDINTALGEAPGVECSTPALAIRLRRVLIEQAMPRILASISVQRKATGA
jgi:hypothetical protein